MAKKIIRVEVVAELEVDTDWYDGMTDEEIVKSEKNGWLEWIGENVISENIIIKDA